MSICRAIISFLTAKEKCHEKSSIVYRLSLICALALGFNAHHSLSFAQSQAAVQTQAIDFSKLKGGWMFATKEGKQLAVLHITKVDQTSNNAPSIEGIFSNSHGSIKSNYVSFDYDQSNRTLKYKTRSGLIFQVNLANDLVLNGQVIDGKTSYSKDAVFTLTKITQTTATPESCGSFFGVWEGQWTNGSLPPALLFVANVKSDCTATVAANGGQNAQNSKIEDKKFSYMCNSATQGTCVLSMTTTDALAASYTNPSGGRNSAAYKRIVFTE